MQSSTPRGFCTGNEANVLSDIEFCAASNNNVLPASELLGMAESQKELCTMRGITPHQFVETYGLQDSFMLDNQFSMFGLNKEGKDKTQEHPRATRLEEWILLAHKMKDIVN